MNTEELIYYLGFSAFEGIGPLRFKLLYDYFGSAKRAWEASEKDLRKINFGEKLTAKFISFRTHFSFEKILTTLQEKYIIVITRADKRYPKLLTQIPDPPIVLYIRGNIRDGLLNSTCIGVVGTRKISNYGRDVTRKISLGLASAGVTIVSGMAYGVDTVAHESAIEAGGKTIAVLGCGVDVIYPMANEKIYWDIVKKYGAVISEFPPGMVTARGLFPSRNRIISGLSLGTVVTEGARDSGALITAKSALEQGREVFAVPGPITSSLSAAPTILLKQGAKLVTEAGDILDEFNIKNLGQRPIVLWTKILNIPKLTNDEMKIIEALQRENLYFDDLVRKIGITPSKMGSVLTLLEMKRIIHKDESSCYSLKSK